ncbi:MAG: hypothetical protein HYY84_17165 [Deltaproteobacteria bacterium]|nr:hypothetical protein [Deltaproteobacteria bacterium]
MHEKSRRDIETLITGGAFLEWWDDVGLARDREASIAAKLQAIEEEVAMHDQVAAGLERDAAELLIEVGELDAEAAKREAERTQIETMTARSRATYEAAKLRAAEAWTKHETAGAGRDKRDAQQAYQKAVEAKDTAWNAVDAAAAHVTRLAIQIGELRVLARRKKAMAEKVLADTRLVRAAARERRADATHTENALEVARHATRKLLHEAAHRFDALVISEYLYWCDSSNTKHLLCVPACSQIGLATVHIVATAEGIQSIEHILSAPKLDVEPTRAAANS